MPCWQCVRGDIAVRNVAPVNARFCRVEEYLIFGTNVGSGSPVFFHGLSRFIQSSPFPVSESQNMYILRQRCEATFFSTWHTPFGSNGSVLTFSSLRYHKAADAP